MNINKRKKERQVGVDFRLVQKASRNHRAARMNIVRCPRFDFTELMDVQCWTLNYRTLLLLCSFE